MKRLWNDSEMKIKYRAEEDQKMPKEQGQAVCQMKQRGQQRAGKLFKKKKKNQQDTVDKKT